MIVKTNQGYKVVSAEGKPLTLPNLTKEEAIKRQYQVEFFKTFIQNQRVR